MCKIPSINSIGFRGTILGVSIIRVVIFWVLDWGFLILGNYHIGFRV